MVKIWSVLDEIVAVVVVVIVVAAVVVVAALVVVVIDPENLPLNFGQNRASSS